ncbi:hypothetical protein Tco_1511596, partial [Tanacetum coccineum]
TMAPKKRTTRASLATITITTTPVTNAQLKALIDQGIADALAVHDVDRSWNGDDRRNSGTGSRRTERTAREFENQVKFATCTLHSVSLTWWNTRVKIVGHDAAYSMPWKTLDAVEIATELIKSVMASKPKTMQDAVEIATELMEKKISTLVERQAKNKRKLDNNNQAQQQPPKKQGVAIAYTAGSGERKEYTGTLPLCNKCKFHHNGQCTIKCANCKRVGHL